MKNKAIKIILIFVTIFTCIGTGSIYVHGMSRKARGKSLTNPHKYFAQTIPKMVAPTTKIDPTEEENKNDIDESQTTNLKETTPLVDSNDNNLSVISKSISFGDFTPGNSTLITNFSGIFIP